MLWRKYKFKSLDKLWENIHLRKDKFPKRDKFKERNRIVAIKDKFTKIEKEINLNYCTIFRKIFIIK